MKHTDIKVRDRVLAVILTVMMIVAAIPVHAHASEPVGYATVETYTGGTVTGNGTANVEVVIEETTLQHVEANDLRAAGWWVGIKVTAPAGYSSDASYKVKSGPNAEYGEAKSFVGNRDGENDIQLWFSVSPTSLEKFLSEKRNLTLYYTFDWDGDETYEQNITFSVVPSAKIVLMEGDVQRYPYGHVDTFTGGTVTNNGTGNVEVVIEETTLQFVEKNKLRDEGWWVGIKVTAPAGYSSDASYKVKSGPNAEYGDAKSFVGNRDGENDIQLWFAVSPTSLEKFLSEKRNLTLYYTFDWDGDETYEQNITFSVVPSGKIILMKDGVQEYPATKGFGTVSTYTGGTVTGNGTNYVEVVIEETTLQYVEANNLRAAGWWVGIKVTAPEGFSVGASYKSKSNPNGEFGSEKSFAEAKDGADYIQMWFPVSPESINSFMEQGRNLTMTYAFDWDNNDTYEQTIVFSVVPSEKIVLKEGEKQIYPELFFNVTAESFEGGSITFVDFEGSELTVENTESVGYVVKADEGYQIVAVFINGRAISVNDKEYKATLSNIKENITISATVVKLHTVTVEFEEGGNVVTAPGFDESGTVIVENGQKLTITANPGVGYHVEQVLINGELQELDENNSITIDVTEDCEILVTFAKNVYTISVEESENGTVTVDRSEVTHGESVKVTLDPAEGYTVGEILVNGALVSEVTKDLNGIWFEISDVISDVTVQVTYKKTATATKEDLVIDRDGAALRIDADEYDNVLIVKKDGESIVLSAKNDKYGIRVLINGSVIAGGENENAITVSEDIDFHTVQLYYKAEGELYEDWHTVEVGIISTVTDKGTINIELVPDKDAGYYNSDVTFTVNVEDGGSYSGIQKIEYEIVMGEIASSGVLYEFKDVIENLYSGEVVVDAEKFNGRNVILTVTVYDRAGNKNTVSKVINVNSTKPSVSLSLSGTPANGALAGYYNGDRELTITVTDREDTFLKENVVSGLVIKKNGSVVEVKSTDISWNGSVGTYRFSENGSYSWSFSYTNKAGLSCEEFVPSEEHFYEFYVDKDDPTSLSIEYSQSKFQTLVNNIVSTLTFGFYKNTLKVTLKANDASSGIQKIVYSYMGEEIEVENTGENENELSVTFEIAPQSRGKIAFTAIDKAGRKASYEDGKIIVVDDIAPNIEVSFDNNSFENDNYFKADRTVTIKIKEANFFGTQEWNNADFYKNEETGEEYLVIKVGKRLNHEKNYTETNIMPEFKPVEGEEDTYVATYTFDEEADYILDIKYTDRSGNVNDVEPIAFVIDKTVPQISIEEADKAQLDADRTATVTVIEHNFDPSDFVFDVSAADADDNVITLSKDFKALLQDRAMWTHTDGTDIWTATVTFTDEGHYTVKGTCKDLAGNDQEKAIEDAFCIDKTAPTDLKIEYAPTFTGTLLQLITFGFYKAPVKVTISANDPGVGVSEFVYSYTVEERASSVNAGKVDVQVVATKDVDNQNLFYTTFEIPAQFRGKISFTAIDELKHKAGYVDGNVIVVDDIAPNVEVSFDNNLFENGNYFKADRTVTIKIKEANFFGTQEWNNADFNKNEETGEEYLVITVGKRLNHETDYTETNIMPEFKPVEGEEDTYVATYTFDEDAAYTFDIKYTDRSGNVYDSYPGESFVIDKVAPVINVSYTNNDCRNEKFFAADRTVTMQVTEANFNSELMTVMVNNGQITPTWKQVQDAEFTYEATIDFSDGAHTFSVEGKDLAGNNGVVKLVEGTKAPYDFVIDKTAPVELSISYDSSFIDTVIEKITFGFYKAPVKVTITATDDVSAIDYFKYSYKLQDHVSSKNKGEENVIVDHNGEKNNDKVTFEIPAQFRGCVSFEAVNMSGLVSSMSDERVVVVDDIAPNVEVSFDNNSFENGKYLKADRTVTIKIKEANFFGTQEWGNADFYKNEEKGEEYLVITVGKRLNHEKNYTETNIMPEFKPVEGEEDTYVATYTFDEDADYTFDIKYTDRSGNVYDDYEQVEFVIDKTAPKISVEEGKGAYLNADRTATVTVIEYNFDPSDFVFDVSAVDVKGYSIALSQDFKNLLQDRAMWTHTDGTDIWTATVTFTDEGNYTVKGTCKDLAGNDQEKAIYDTFCIDKSAPIDLRVEYNPTFIGTLLQTITFGFYKAPVKVTIYARDQIAGVSEFVYSYTVEEGASSVNAGKENVHVEATRNDNDNDKSLFYTTFEISAQFRGKISFTAIDKSKNETYRPAGKDDPTIVVDDIAPNVEVSFDNNSFENGKYLKADRTVTIKIKEANFFGTQEWDNADFYKNEETGEEYLVITVGKRLNHEKNYTETKIMPEFKPVEGEEDTYVATYTFDEDADYTFDIKYTDRSGNVYDGYEQVEFVIDKTVPVIEISYDDNKAAYKNGNQFRTDREATIKVTEHNFNKGDVQLTVKEYGTIVSGYTDLLKNAEWSDEGNDVHVAKVSFTNEAHYELSLTYTDLAGNVDQGVASGKSVAPWAFTIDKTAPTDLDILIADVTVKGDENTFVFNTFYEKTVSVKLVATFDISGMHSMSYQKLDTILDYDENRVWTEYNSETGIVVSPSEKFVIYFRAEDRAGNVSIIRSTGIVVDDEMPDVEIDAPDIDIVINGANEKGFYNEDVDVSIKVSDPEFKGNDASDNGYYSGLNMITYSIYVEGENIKEEGVLFDIENNAIEGAEFDADKLAKAWKGAVEIASKKFNSNNVIFRITAVDNSGNIRISNTDLGEIKIDITAPVIEITYDNTDVDSGKYYNRDRQATIRVTERNFVESDIQLTLTSSDGVIPQLSKWEKVVEGTGNGDNTEWEAKIVFEGQDSDYTFGVVCTDPAGWSDEYETVEFTVDKTLPIVKVEYDNNTRFNSNYYSAKRTATVYIAERNIDPEGADKSRVQPVITAHDNGNAITAPVVSKWTATEVTVDGQKIPGYKATIEYKNDALYTFDISVADKAGNACADFAKDSFYVDNTDPVITISGIVNESANNAEGNIGFVITATDTNFDVFKPVLTAVVKNGDQFETKELEIGEFADITNGKTFTVTNLEQDGIYRIVCTVTDKANREYKTVLLENAEGKQYAADLTKNDTLVTFSVNRDGSTFELGKDIADVVSKYYVQNVKNDIVITEINADPLQSYKVTLNGKALAETDYKVVQTGGDGAWMKYTYTVSKDLFAKEGEYTLVVSSKDKANNDAFSDVKDATVRFVVDRTAPVVTVSGMATNGRYQTESQTVTLIPTDDGGALKSIVVRLVDADGKMLSELINLSGEALIEALEANEGMINFQLGEALYQNVQIICTDSATDGSEETNTYDMTFKNVSVSSNAFMIFWANQPARWSTIGGISAAAIALIVFIILKKRKGQAV